MIHDLSQSNIFTQHEIIIKVLIIPQEVFAARYSLNDTFTRDRAIWRYLAMAVYGMKKEFAICAITQKSWMLRFLK